MDHAATSTGGNVDTQCTRDYTSDFTTTRTFKSKDELTIWVLRIGRSKGFVIVTLRSDSGAGKKRPSVTLSCERSGKWDKRSNHKETKKCSCPFRLKGEKVAANDEWKLTVVDGRHNHEAGQAEEGHSFAGKLSQEEKSLLKGLSKRGVQPKEILRELRQRDEDSKSTLRTIYNGCQRLRVLRKLEDYNLRLQQLMRKASEYNYIEKHRVIPKKDTVLEFFCTHPTSLEWLSAFPRVLGMEYRHHLWGEIMGRLNIFGITSTNISFYVASAFFSPKYKSSCGWALSTLRGAMDDKGVAMPDVIMLSEDIRVKDWKPLTKAIEDVFSPAKLVFPWSDDYVRPHYCLTIYNSEGQLNFVDEWRVLVASDTEAEYDKQLKRLHTEFFMFPEALERVTNTMLKLYKEKLVAAWTNNIMHFGYTDKDVWDSTLEHFFWYLPLERSRDIFWKNVDDSRENVHKRIKASFVESLTNEDEEYEDEEYRELRGVVSIIALRKICTQTMLIDKIDTNHSVCNCAIKRTHGLPCAHEIAKYRTEGRPIPLDCIHPHWKKLDLEPLTRTAESDVDKMMKMNNSTPSAPLLSQIVESRQRNSPNAGLSIVHSNQERQPEAEDKEKIEKLRRRQQLQALLAIKKQQQQFSHQVSCTNQSSTQKCPQENQIQHPDRADLEVEDLSTLPSLDPNSPIEQDDSNTVSAVVEYYSAEDTILYRLQDIIAKLDLKTRLCIRDSLLRLAQTTVQRHYTSDTSSSNKNSKDEHEVITKEEIDSCNRYTSMPDVETETIPIDVTVAHLVFHRPLDLSGKHSGPPESPVSTKLLCERKTAGLANLSNEVLPDSLKNKQKYPQQDPGSYSPDADPQSAIRVYHNQSTKPLEFIDVCPLVLRPYILDVKDVARDGHCGFRAIASLCNNDEDGWMKVRKNLINELKSNEAHYVQLFGSVQRVNQLHHALNYFGSSCHREHWMTMPDMGHIIASCYNVILIHVSSAQCFTFFPLRTVPISASSPIEIAIGLVEEHFVQVFLKSGHPMPPIPPDLTQKRKNIPPVATDWETTLEQRCTEWASPYIARIDHFKSLQPQVVLQKNPIVIATDSLPSLENMDYFFDYIARDQTRTWSNYNFFD